MIMVFFGAFVLWVVCIWHFNGAVQTMLTCACERHCKVACSVLCAKRCSRQNISPCLFDSRLLTW